MSYKIGPYCITDNIKAKLENIAREISGGENISIQVENAWLGACVRAVTKGYVIFTFSLTEMPGCCAYCISFNTYVNPRFRRRGIAQRLQGIKEEIAKGSGFTHLICTAKRRNEIQNHILTKYGWYKLHETVSERTGNELIMWLKDLSKEA